MMTPININDPARICGIATYCAGIATQAEKDKMSGPRGILEHIINFFTFGRVRRDNIRAFDEFADTMTTALKRASPDGNTVTIPERLVVEFSGYTITFTQPGELHNAAGPVTIEVSQSGKAMTAEVNKKQFCRIITALQLRHLGELPCTAVVLTENNHMKLQEANLCGVDLRGVDLSRAILSRADLNKADLSRADLNKADLSRADLRGADLSRADLSEVILKEANLNNADLNNANLRYANLNDANLSGANLSRADLNYANLSGANLSEANLSDAKLNHADLSDANLIKTNLSEANLSGANLIKTNLSGANLSDANLSDANLRGANLSEANLSEANLSRTNLCRADLRGADLSHIPQQGDLLALPGRWDEVSLDIFLNHINNPDAGSLLTTIDSIDARYASVKMRMVRELITSLADTDTSGVALPLMDILSKQPFIDETDIATWTDTLCTTYLDRHNERLLPGNEGVLNQSVGLFTRQPAYMFSHNGAFIQIVAQGMAENSPPERKCKVAELYNTYLRDTRIQPYSTLYYFGDLDGKGRPDWENKEATNLILIPAQPENVSAMLLSLASLEGMLRPQPQTDTQWDRFYLHNSPDHCLAAKEYPDLNTLFTRDFPIFNAPYQYAQKNAQFFLLLRALNLGDSLSQLFITAAEATSSATKLVDDEAQTTLGKIFSPKLVSSPRQPQGNSLEEAHYGELINTYKLTQAGDADKAKTLLCLAALFTRYSSSLFFGTEDESPQLLRNYAYALMEKAHSLDANIVGTAFSDWTNKLLGLKGAFTCSAVLSNQMIEYIQVQYPDVLAAIMPPAWH